MMLDQYPITDFKIVRRFDGHFELWYDGILPTSLIQWCAQTHIDVVGARETKVFWLDKVDTENRRMYYEEGEKSIFVVIFPWL